MHTQYTHMPPVLILHLLSYGYTSSHDGELNAQKLSNRSRLIDSFDFKCVTPPTPPPPSPPTSQLPPIPTSLSSSSTCLNKNLSDDLKPTALSTSSTTNTTTSGITTRRSTQQLRQQQEMLLQKQKLAEENSNQQFKLFAVVMHSGQTLNSGHYTAFINYKIVTTQGEQPSLGC